jgi:hypothetical protein
MVNEGLTRLTEKRGGEVHVMGIAGEIGGQRMVTGQCMVGDGGNGLGGGGVGFERSNPNL